MAAGSLRPRDLLWRAVGTRRHDVVAASLLYTGHQVGEAFVPVLIGAVVSQAIVPGGTGRIALWLGILAVNFFLFSMSYRFGARASMRAKQGTEHVVRMWLTDRVVTPGGGVTQSPGELLSRASSDASRVGGFAGMVAFTTASFSVLIVATVLLFTFSAILAVVILGGTVLLLLVQNRVSSVLLRRSSAEQQETADATAMAEDLVRGLRVLKGIGAETAAGDGYLKVSQSALRASLHSVSAEARLTATGTLVTGLYFAAIAGVGGWLALSGRLGLGPLVSALGLAQFVFGPMQTLARISAVYARATASAERICGILALPVEVKEGPEVVSEATARLGEVRFEHVCPSDAGRSSLSFVAPGARMTGVVAADPSLAAALPTLLARERDPSAGSISVGGVPIDRWPLDVLRSMLLVAPHDAPLFGGTVADNVTISSRDDAAVRAATHASMADQVIDTLPRGAQTTIGDRGHNVSGGQRQRLALARVLAAQPPILVLHDPTSSVDAATESLIGKRLQDLRRGHTTLLITSSPALLASCDQVIFLDGDTVHTDSHANLLAAHPAYRERVTR